MTLRERPKELSSAIRAHPRFAAAARAFTAEYLAWRTSLGSLNKVISNSGRERLLEHVLFLHLDRGAPGAENGATFERLLALAAARDRVGARAVRTGLALAQAAGLLVLTRRPGDNRFRIFEPTGPAFALAQDAYSVTFDAWDALAPALGVKARLVRNPKLFLDILSRLGRAYLHAEPAPDDEPDVLSDLLRLEGGRPVLVAAVDAYERGGDLPTSQEMAERFQVSPSQIRAVLKAAQARELLEVAGRGRLERAEPLVEAYLASLCRYLGFFGRHALDLDASIFKDACTTA